MTIFLGDNLKLQYRKNSLANGAKVLELVFQRKDNSVNVFDRQTLEEFAEVTAKLSGLDAAALLVKSGSDGFIAGADVKEFSELFSSGDEVLLAELERCNQAFTDFSRLPFPILAAINGFAMGGGLELALCCDFRLLTSSARIGLPEVKLGIIPGFGGTVRMPRLVGVDNAVEWVCTGQDFKADKALADGVVDGVVEETEFDKAVESYLERIISGEFNWESRRQQTHGPLLLDDIEKQMAFTTTRALVASQASKHMPAPLTAHKAMKKHAGMNVEEAVKTESQLFADLATGAVSRALVGLYLNEKLLARDYRSDIEKEKQLAVIGAGIMGGGIAYQAADKSYRVILKDINQQALDLGINEAVKLWEKKLSRGRLDSAGFASKLSSIKPVLDNASLEGSTIAIEAVVENRKIKQSVLAEVESHLPDDAVICSNTSTIEITNLASKLKRPGNFCGMHFFNPVHRMPLVEIIRGEKTTDATITRAVEFAVAIGKKPVVVNDCAGFYVNRVLFPYLGAFNQLLHEGIDFRHIDSVMESMGWPMGPAYLLDVVGMDTAVHAANVMAEAFPERMSASFETAIERLYSAGRLGQKNSQGFYAYTIDPKGKPVKKPDDDVLELVYTGNVDIEAELPDELIVDRLMFPMIYEVVRCLDESIVEDFPSADLGLVMGIGFPLHLGGPLRWFDEQIRGGNLEQRMQVLEPLGEMYRIPSSVQQRVESSSLFYPAGGQS